MLIYGVGPFFLLVACAQRFAQNQKPNTFPENIKYMHNRLPDSIVNWDSQKTNFPNGHTDVQARIRQKRRAKFSLMLFTERRHVERELRITRFDVFIPMHPAFNLRKTIVPVCSIACINVHPLLLYLIFKKVLLKFPNGYLRCFVHGRIACTYSFM